MAKIKSKENLKVQNSAELLSYVINQTPQLRDNIDLPVQGESINGIGKIIMKNIAYKNAFLNIIKMSKENIIKNKYTFNDVKKLVPNVNLGFLNTKTIYKVKDR